MANPVRGDISIEVDGASHTLRLTLAALAEIEAALDVDGFAALGAALKRLDAHRLTQVLSAMLRAGGSQEAERLAKLAEPAAAARAVAACFSANLQ
jgi:hypothetical protein